MAAYAQKDYTVAGKAPRKLLVTAVEIGNKWCVVGAGVESSTVDYSADTETTTDILGVTSTDVNKLEPSQSLDAMKVKKGNPLLFKLEDIIERNAVEELSTFKVMIIRAYINEGTDDAPKYHAEVHENCTITPTSIGGDSYVEMPITINYSNEKTLGTVNHYKFNETIEFTPNTAAAAPVSSK